MTEFALNSVRFVPNYRLRMASLMFLADVGGLLLANLLGWMAVSRFLGVSAAQNEVGRALFVLVALVLFMVSKLYPGVGINPADEIRRVSQYTLIALAFAIIVDFLVIPASLLRLISHFVVWLLAPLFVLALRWAVRITAVQFGFWREPVLVIARGKKATEMVHYFRKRLRLGYWPVLAVSDEAGVRAYQSFSGEAVVQVNQWQQIFETINTSGVQTALVDLAITPDLLASHTGNLLRQQMTRLIFIADLSNFDGVSLAVHDMEGLLGIETRKNEISPFNLMIKSLMDFCLAFFGLLLLAPVLGMIALLIKLDSPGNVFYRHERIGKGERKIKVIKFRTMIQNADAVLQAYLQANPAARAEWDSTQKLKDDPRITRTGRWLRKFSLDELPQLLNVLRGDISLVGARPIVRAEIHHYGAQYAVYTRFKPGLTGLWQVSGRNNTTYDERVRYDTYYIHNWSIWLDVYILLRTVWVVLSRDGAY